MKKITRYSGLLLFVLNLSLFSRGQALHFQSYTTANGLSQNSIYSIAQTREGFMWFGTQDGLNRFDGNNFWLVGLSDPQGKYRFAKMITALLADTKDQLWVGTVRELLIYDRYINRFYSPEKIYKGFVLPGNHYIKKLLEDRQGNIWVLTQKEGLFVYSPSEQKMLQIAWPGAAPGEIVSITEDRSGGIWMSSPEQIYKWNGNGFNLVTIKQSVSGINDICVTGDDIWLTRKFSEVLIIKPKEGFKVYPFSKIFKHAPILADPHLLHQSDSNTIWIGSRSEGLLKVNLADMECIKSRNGSGYPFLISPFCLSFFTSNRGITWFGLSGGIAMYDKNKLNISLWRDDAVPGRPFPDNRVFSIYTPNDNDFYLGTLYNGLHHLNISTGQSEYIMPPGLDAGSNASKNIYQVIAGEKEKIWMATWAGLYSFETGSKKFQRYYDAADNKTLQLTSILMLGNTKKILVGGYNDGLRIFNTATAKWEKCIDPKKIADTLSFRVRYMKETVDGNIFMSTEGKCLLRYNYLSGEFTFYPQFEAISGASRYFLEDGPTLWVGTDDGLIQVNKSSMKVQKIWSTANGLPNNYIYGILTDRFNRVWISSNAGLSMLDPQTGRIKNFNTSDGLQDMEFNTASCYTDKKHRLWFGGVNGLNMIDPPFSQLRQESSVPLVTKINVMNAPYTAGVMAPYVRSIRLPYSKNFISFEFQAPDFSEKRNEAMQYMLTEVDSGWINSQGRNVASYTQLTPGRYIFKVRIANEQNSQSEPIVIRIIPPWYKTWWFYTLSAFLVITASFFFIRTKVASVKYKADTRRKIAETEMAALKAQMNPHFMFNCINSIDSFIQTNDKYNATLYLNKFAKLIRNVLDSSKQNLVPFSKDIETLKLYIELEELRHENKFSTRLDIDPELLINDYKVPPLIIQPFVENAILHGLKNRSDNDGRLVIHIIQEHNKLHYFIADNGIGRKAAAGINQNKDSSYGMQLSFDRIKLFNNEKEASVTVEDLYAGGKAAGTSVTVLLKIV